MSRRGDQVMSWRGDQVMSRSGHQVMSRRGDQVMSRRGDQVMSWRGDQAMSWRGDQVMSRRGNQVMSRRGNQVMSWRGDQVMSRRGNQVMSRRGEAWLSMSNPTTVGCYYFVTLLRCSFQTRPRRSSSPKQKPLFASKKRRGWRVIWSGPRLFRRKLTSCSSASQKTSRLKKKPRMKLRGQLGPRSNTPIGIRLLESAAKENTMPATDHIFVTNSGRSMAIFTSQSKSPRPDLYAWDGGDYPHKIAFRKGTVLYQCDRYGKQITI